MNKCQYNANCDSVTGLCDCYTFEKWTKLMSSKYINWIPITQKHKTQLIENDLYYEYLKNLKKKISPKIVWLTIRPKKCDEYEFKEFVEKILNWKCVENYYCAYEWKHNEESSGLHAHILLEGQNKRILENIRKKSKVNTFKKIGKCMFFAKLINRDLLQDKIDYVNGKTWEDEKNEHKKSDSFYRKKYGMPNISTFQLTF